MPEHLLADVDATRSLARELAGRVQPDQAVLLDGPLGAGKTTFVRAFVEALGGDPALVSSPTFTLLHQYDARLPVVHVDAYRLGHGDELEALGFAEAWAGGIALVEWADRVVESLPPDRLWRVRLAHADQGRVAQVEGPGETVRSPESGVRSPEEARVTDVPPVSGDGVGTTTSDPGPRTPDPGSAHREITIPTDAQGRDPLVVAFAETHAQDCALRTVSGRAFLIGVVLSLVGGLLASRFLGTVPEGLDVRVAPLAAWLSSPGWFAAGVACATAVVIAGGVLRVRLATAASTAANRPLPIAQEALWAGALVVLAQLLLWDPVLALALAMAGLCLVYAAAISFRLLALALGGRRGFRVAEPAEPDGGWPIVTVLVPMYREREVAAGILRSLAALDYPRDRLDVKLLLEADDPETLPALRAAGIPAFCEVVVVPQAQPKTKPRACNHGLERARGEFLVIFDAEDRPDPDQLKQAVLAFRAAPESTACLQAQLAYHNHAGNLLTRWFAGEYNLWFRRYLPGLLRLGVPIPLGGTSNHFRTAALRRLGGWDPFNVTEDCDLGVRLHLAGLRTGLLDSTTWEEAVDRVPTWMRQRTRWLKGYLVTHWVWSRRPLNLLQRLGPWATGGFLLSVGAVPVLAAVNLVLWLSALLYGVGVVHDLWFDFSLTEILSARDLAQERWSWPLWYGAPGEDPFLGPLSQILAVASIVLVFGNVLFVAAAMIFGRRANQPGLAQAALLIPLYWVLLSLAAWRALWQALTTPHKWEKTVHGHTTLERPESGVRSPGSADVSGSSAG